MPTLPTLTVTDAQATRMIAAFGSTTAYKEWLKQAIVDHVVRTEQSGRDEAFRDQRTADMAAARTDLTA